MSSTTLGVLFGNRDFFPDHLVTEARKDIVGLFQKLSINHIMLDEQDTKLGGVETFQGTIDFVSHLVDSSDHFLVYAEFDNPRKANGRWTVRPGLEAKLTVRLADPSNSK